MDAGIVLSVINFFRGILKDVKNCFKWKEEDKIVDNNWFKNSGLEEKLKHEGSIARWSTPDKVNNRLLDGYEIYMLEDKKKRIRYRLVNSNKILIIKPKK